MSIEVISTTEAESLPLPGAALDAGKMPGHWLLARLGKRVLRPGGIEATQKLLTDIAPVSTDDVVEFAPGLGITARMTLKHRPRSYTAIERDEEAAARVRSFLRAPEQQCRVATAQETGLAESSVSIVYGEAMLTMQGDEQKKQIIREAARILRRGGRYGIHELAIAPDDAPEELRDEIHRDLISSIHVNARPLTKRGWEEVLEACGFEVETSHTIPMRLLEYTRAIRDEGIFRFLKIFFNVIRNPVARRRVLEMRSVFRKHARHMTAVVIVARRV